MFLGHTNDLADGQLKSLEFLDNKKFLLNQNGEFKLGNNICPHQNSRIISGTKDEIKCQYHGWSWSKTGAPTSSGSSAMCNEVKLYMKSVYEYNGLLFEANIDLSMLDALNFKNLELTEFRVDTVNADPRMVMDIFLDVDHIPVVHNGVYDLLGIEGEAKVDWEYRDWGNAQKVSNEAGELIAVWIAVYPYTMIEWQNGALFISRCFDNNKIAIWKYKDSADSVENYKINSDMWETAFAQDKAQAEQMVRFPSANLEEAKQNYRQWLSNNGFTS
jgi:phenylpropionate dioxygenase-like ring-hydroxylating dioxygenase large terminal subunit